MTENVIHLEPEPAHERGSANQLNVRRELHAHPATKELVGLDEFQRQITLLRPIPRPGLKLDPDFKPRPWRDTDETALAEHLLHRGFKRIENGLISKVIALEAEARRFSPPADLLTSFTWDGKERMSRFFIDHCGVEVTAGTDREKYVEAVSRCFFISVAARTFQPGCKADCMLILEGMQGKRKSSLLRLLSLKDEWFSDSLTHNLSDKDARTHLPGKLIVEMSEISQFKKSQTETVKSFLSCQIDRFRPPYGKHDVYWPRANIFVGSTNDDAYLLDMTGNRRFWPIKITRIDLTVVGKVVEQIYAEAVVGYRNGEPWWLGDNLEEVAAIEQDERRQGDPWEEKIRIYLSSSIFANPNQTYVTTSMILDHLAVLPPLQTRAYEMRVGQILRTLGFERKTIWPNGEKGGKPFKGYVLPVKEEGR